MRAKVRRFHQPNSTCWSSRMAGRNLRYVPRAFAASSRAQSSFSFYRRKRPGKKLFCLFCRELIVFCREFIMFCRELILFCREFIFILPGVDCILPWADFILPWVNCILPWADLLLPWVNFILPWADLVLPSVYIVLPWVNFILPWRFIWLHIYFVVPRVEICFAVTFCFTVALVGHRTMEKQ